MGSNSIPPKTPSDESINRGLVCAHMHFIARTQKILTFMSRRVNAGNKNTPSTHHPRRRNVTTLMVGLKKRSHTQKSHPKVVNPQRYSWGPQKKKKKKKKLRRCQPFALNFWIIPSYNRPLNLPCRPDAENGTERVD